MAQRERRKRQVAGEVTYEQWTEFDQLSWDNNVTKSVVYSYALSNALASEKFAEALAEHIQLRRKYPKDNPNHLPSPTK